MTTQPEAITCPVPGCTHSQDTEIPEQFNGDRLTELLPHLDTAHPESTGAAPARPDTILHGKPQPLDLDAIQHRCDAAEDGWVAVRDTDDPYRFEIHGNGPTNVAVLGGDPDDAFASYPVEENARFIAHARQDVPALLARVRELEAQLRRATRSSYSGRHVWEAWAEEGDRTLCTTEATARAAAIQIRSESEYDGSNHPDGLVPDWHETAWGLELLDDGEHTGTFVARQDVVGPHRDETDRYRTAWQSARRRARATHQLLDIAEFGRDYANETAEQLQAMLDLMPRCQAPHPTVDEARCELILQHPGWHAHPVGAWPYTPQSVPSGPQTPAYWLSEYAGTEPTLWTTEAGALDYCTDLARDEGIRSWDWFAEDDAQQMIYVHPDTDAPLSLAPGRVTELRLRGEEGPTRPA